VLAALARPCPHRREGEALTHMGLGYQLGRMLHEAEAAHSPGRKPQPRGATGASGGGMSPSPFAATSVVGAAAGKAGADGGPLRAFVSVPHGPSAAGAGGASAAGGAATAGGRRSGERNRGLGSEAGPVSSVWGADRGPAAAPQGSRGKPCTLATPCAQPPTRLALPLPAAAEQRALRQRHCRSGRSQQPGRQCGTLSPGLEGRLSYLGRRRP
jgi:hypothetical protein